MATRPSARSTSRGTKAVSTQAPPALAKAEARAVGDVEPRFIDHYLLYLLARASYLISAEFHATLARQNVPVPVWRVLASLSGAPDIAVGQLAKHVLAKHSTLTKVLDRMEASGLIARSGVEDDRRRVIVRMTAAGEALFAALLPQAKAHEAAVFAKFSLEDAATLRSILRVVIGRFGDAEFTFDEDPSLVAGF